MPWILACTTDELSQSWQIDRLRVLGVASEPAEPAPGELVTFSSLTVSPVEPWALTAWMLCFDPENTEFGCEVDLDALDADATMEELAAAGFIGVEPYLPPTWTVPPDALDELDAEAQLEGVNAFVNLAAFHEGDGGTDSGMPDLDTDDAELAFKRVPVSRALTPNHNPTIAAVEVDGVRVEPGGRVVVDAGQPYTVAAVLAEDAVETYTYRTEAGADETRSEEPYLSFYVQEGEFEYGQSSAVWDDVATDWIAPAAPESPDQSMWIVVRDRRGGMGWTELRFHVR